MTDVGVTRRSLLVRAGAWGGSAAVGISGCAPLGGPPGAGTPGTAPEVSLRTLTWLKEWGDLLPQLAPRLREQQRVALEVELAAVGVTPWAEKLQALFAADAAPDVLQGRANVDPLFQDGGMFLDLTARVQRDRLRLDPATYALSGTERWCGKVYARGYGIHFRHHNTGQGWDLYAEEGRKVIEGEAALGQGLTELNRRLNDLVRFGACRPYAGLRHPIRP
jgi:hypothetical protein